MNSTCFPLQVQKSLSEKTADTPAVAKVPAVGKALARVLSAVTQGEMKENDLKSLSFPVESGQVSDSPLPQPPDPSSTHTITKPTGKSHHWFGFFLIV